MILKEENKKESVSLQIEELIARKKEDFPFAIV